MPVELPVHEPQDKGKNKLKVDDNVVPFQYTSKQCIFPGTSNIYLFPGFVNPFPTFPVVKYKLLLVSFLQK